MKRRLKKIANGLKVRYGKIKDKIKSRFGKQKKIVIPRDLKNESIVVEEPKNPLQQRKILIILKKILIKIIKKGQQILIIVVLVFALLTDPVAARGKGNIHFPTPPAGERITQILKSAAFVEPPKMFPPGYIPGTNSGYPRYRTPPSPKDDPAKIGEKGHYGQSAKKNNKNEDKRETKKQADARLQKESEKEINRKLAETRKNIDLDKLKAEAEKKRNNFKENEPKSAKKSVKVRFQKATKKDSQKKNQNSNLEVSQTESEKWQTRRERMKAEVAKRRENSPELDKALSIADGDLEARKPLWKNQDVVVTTDSSRGISRIKRPDRPELLICKRSQLDKKIYHNPQLELEIAKGYDATNINKMRYDKRAPYLAKNFPEMGKALFDRINEIAANPNSYVRDISFNYNRYKDTNPEKIQRGIAFIERDTLDMAAFVQNSPNATELEAITAYRPSDDQLIGIIIEEISQ